MDAVAAETVLLRRKEGGVSGVWAKGGNRDEERGGVVYQCANGESGGDGGDGAGADVACYAAAGGEGGEEEGGVGGCLWGRGAEGVSCLVGI